MFRRSVTNQMPHTSTRNLHSNGDNSNTGVPREICCKGSEVCVNTLVTGMTTAGVTAEMVANTPIMLYFSAVLRPCQ